MYSYDWYTNCLAHVIYILCVDRKFKKKKNEIIRGHRRSQHEARGGNCLLLNFQISNDFASRFASSNKKMIHISTNYYKLVFVLQRCSLPLIPRTLVLREGEVCFRFFENIRKF